MSDSFPRWSDPAEKSDVIKLGIRFLGVSNALGSTLARVIAGDETAARVELGRYFDAMKAMSEVLDEIAGRAED